MEWCCRLLDEMPQTVSHQIPVLWFVIFIGALVFTRVHQVARCGTTSQTSDSHTHTHAYKSAKCKMQTQRTREDEIQSNNKIRIRVDVVCYRQNTTMNSHFTHGKICSVRGSQCFRFVFASNTARTLYASICLCGTCREKRLLHFDIKWYNRKYSSRMCGTGRRKENVAATDQYKEGEREEMKREREKRERERMRRLSVTATDMKRKRERETDEEMER